MNNMKKLASLLLALVMVLAMAAPAMAYTITAPDNGHTYEVYQIFTGDLSEGVLSNVKWGENGTGTTGEAVADTILEELAAVVNSTDSAKLAVITKYATLTASDAYATIQPNGKLEDVPAGYYLIKDVDGSQANKDDAYTTYIVEIVDDVTITPKSVKPTVDKEVLDETADAEAGATGGWGETADHAINETFQFKLTANLPADTDYDAYETYKVVFNDTMSEGITFERIVSVTVDDVAITDYVTSANLVAGLEGEAAWTLTIEDLKSIEGVTLTDGAVIEVIYEAHLNEEAKVGNVDDNYNKVNLQYSNNPNAGGEGDLGKTPDDTVWVFTYEMPNKKTDEDGEALAGAGFTLYDANNNVVNLIYDATMGAYRPATAAEAGADGYSAEITSLETTGIFTIKGLDVGTYTLKETTTPAGYNTCADITIVISATHAETSDTTAETNIKMTVNGTEATENVVVNKAGSTLPETGGMGTTVIYTVGGLLVAAAVVLLISKKRRAA